MELEEVKIADKTGFEFGICQDHAQDMFNIEKSDQKDVLKVNIHS